MEFKSAIGPTGLLARQAETLRLQSQDCSGQQCAQAGIQRLWLLGQSRGVAIFLRRSETAREGAWICSKDQKQSRWAPA